ncbi:alpha-2-macroglobulin family protein [Flavilitoribacter nigricans]|uniref:Alpha-2-macroglobulin domain-containing protein n=1 Tax=Flavilitoribacter nigricans (strain ATCC 23147 / DSM 23189 / NBRC 102662 / NCIMB 1420 / SS-2) TaxID=1122177 RepID=A0A2D0N563_FLAN2|nr:alpha-2-macroglobulin family protein [Flavilitoribacter nigricans]PHN03299.1 hypothetical protein CRP01_28315 [Flavilitoribacter nigricans DSM 23189 = NBRC 102662]
MKKLHLLLWTALLCSGTLFSQPDLPTYVFSISAQQARYFYQHPYDSLDLGTLRAPIDSFLYTFEEQEREPGHYLYVQPQLEDLEIELRSYYAYQLTPRNNDRDLALELVDAEGRLRPDADIQLGKRRIPYDPDTRTYRRKNWHRDGLLTVSIDRDTLFYELSGNSVQGLFTRKLHYWTRSRVGYWLTAPVRWAKRTYFYFRRGFGWGEWDFYHNPFQFLKGRPGFRGYVATNQPLYRPGDTLMMSAYLTNNRGKPWSRPVAMRITSQDPTSYRSRIIVDSLMRPREPGRVEFIWPLKDTLPLDRVYRINFWHPRRDDFENLQHQFRLEDYELDEAHFSLKLQQEVYHRGESVSLQAEGRDENEKIIAGAELRLTLMVDKIHHSYSDRLSIPDTLWTHRENLKDQESTQLMIPDSIFPAADISLRLFGTFVHPSGELHQVEQSFRHHHRADKLILTLERDSVRAGLERNGQALTGRAVLTRYGAQSEELPEESDTIDLPYREALSPYFQTYELKLDSLRQELEIWGSQESLVSVNGTWQPDTITVSFTNPRRLHITWMLQSRTRDIRRGSFSEPAGTVKIPVGNQAQWELSYEYFWKKPLTHSQEIFRVDKKLEILIEQPPKVSPGETVQVKVRVEDAEGKAAAGVQLAAAAVNAQFKHPQSAYTAPSIPYKTARQPFTIENFSLEPLAAKNSEYYRRGVTAEWFRKLDLRRHPFYQMRFQNNGVWMQWDTLEQDSFYRDVAQVAPYLIRNGKALPVYLLYLNDELVHYYASQDNPPYSFAGRKGYNRITVRTRNEEYTLDSVWLEKGKKLELSIDLDRFENGTSDIQLSRRSIPEQFSGDELALLRKKSLVLIRGRQYPEQYLWDRPTNIHAIRQWPGSESILIVPFAASREINYVRRGKLERKFLFEPGYRYDIAETRERLYGWNSSERFRDDFRQKQPKVHRPGELMLRPEDIRREAPEPTPTLYFSSFTRERVPGKGRLHLEALPPEPDSLPLIAFVLQSEKGTEWVVPSLRTVIGGLEPGNYQLVLVRSDGRVLQSRFALQPNANLILNLSDGTFSEDPFRTWPDRLYQLSQSPQPYRDTSQPTPSPSSRLNPYEGTGRLIRGQVLDDSGEPLIGASILLNGTLFGTITDFDGFYEIWVPAEGAQLSISYTGFNSQDLVVDPHRRNDAVLGVSALALDEVVVVGYGQSLASPRQIVSEQSLQKLQGRVAGVEISVPGSRQRVLIRGLGEPTANQPVVLINGQLSTLEALQLLSPEDLQNLEIVNDPSVLSLYGARAANGVYLVTLKSGVRIPEPEIEAPEPDGSLRDEFRDYAFWQPRLITDRKGEAYFQATFPDNITAWDTYVLGMDRKQRAGVGLARTQSWKSLTARLNVPRFLVEGDAVDLVGQAVNYTRDTFSVATFFRQGDQELFRRDHRLASSLTDRYRFEAGGTVDSVELTYGLEQANYLDGEKRDIPIVLPGSMETEGHFLVLDGDTTIDLSFSKDLPIELFIADNTLELLLEDLNYLRDYPHECMEQTASRLIALKLEEQIRQQLDQEFNEDRMVRKLVKKLEKAQGDDGSWGWWPGRSASLWITRHVLEALRWARTEPKRSVAEERGIRYLVNTLPEMGPQDQLLTLDLLSGFQQQLDYNDYLNRLDSLSLSLHDRLLLTRIRQRADLPYQLDTLDAYRQQTLYGALHWGAPLPAYWTYQRHQHPVANTLIAYDLLKGAGRQEEARRARQYFLENRGIGQPNGRYAWYNTFETARVLAAILPDLLTEGKTFRKNQVQIAGTVLDSFPYRDRITDTREIRLQKTGTGPLYVTAYQQYHNRQPAPKTDIFDITSRLHQNERTVEGLEQGQVATLEVTLKNELDAEYVMLEIPIPAGCSYADRSINWGLEDQREYRREKVVVYCSRLAAGTHTFRVQLEARFSGRFTLNPARAEQMYFPVFFGRNALKKLEVK